MGTPNSVWWIRRDFRLGDNPALGAAIDAGTSVLPLFVEDPTLLARPGVGRSAWLYASLQALDAELRAAGGPGLSVLPGDPTTVVPEVARSVGAATVHIAEDFAPYGRRRDQRVRTACQDAGIELVATGSPYAVSPNNLFNGSGTPFKVFTPFHRAWQSRGVHSPAPTGDASTVRWCEASQRKPLEPADPQLVRGANEKAALESWHAYVAADDAGVTDYVDNHNLPGVDGTSRLSIALRWGHIHPRTVLHDLAARKSKGAAGLSRQIAWRDFFADVLFHVPTATSQPVRPEFAQMETDEPDSSPTTQAMLAAWQQGRTGYPLVDAGMRQMLTDGWMHNRVRMVVASFLIKDLHIGWWHGADWFMERLRDGDIAQNQLNWQWVAGCGTDAAPFFRIFNPVSQSEKFDPEGEYLRRWVPELAGVDPKYVHTPWEDPAGLPASYPARIVDHATERKESLSRYAAIKA